MHRFNISNDQKQLRYVAVYDTLFKMINEGTFPEGSRLPSEPDLAKLIGVSRTTLRQALALLQDDGLVKNIQGRGNFIIRTTPNRSSGLEHLSNPIHKCTTEQIDNVEIEFHIEPPNDHMNQVLERTTPVVVAVDRWYKSKDTVIAYTFSIIPIETISQFNINLNDNDQLLKFLENDIYLNANDAMLEIKHSTSGSFSAKKYTISSQGHCNLIQESLYTDSKYPAIFNKHYLPLETSCLKIHPFVK